MKGVKGKDEREMGLLGQEEDEGLGEGYRMWDGRMDEENQRMWKKGCGAWKEGIEG